MSLKAAYLPIGILIALGIGLIAPDWGAFLHTADWGGVRPKMLCIIVIFLVTGYLLDLDRVVWGGKLLTALVAASLLNLVAGPLLGYAIGQVAAAIMGTPQGSFEIGLLIGFFVFVCVPTTLSSSIVITRTANGNTLWALSMVAVLNILGIFVIPLTLGVMLARGGVDMDGWAMFRNIFLLVIVPLAIGQGLRRLRHHRPGGFLGYVPSTCVILMTWMAVSYSSDSLHKLPLVAVTGLLSMTLVFHFGMMLLARITAGAMRLEFRERWAFIFVVAQKTLPISISVLAILSGTQSAPSDTYAMATVSCVVYYFPQILIDSTIAGFLGRNVPVG